MTQGRIRVFLLMVADLIALTAVWCCGIWLFHLSGRTTPGFSGMWPALFVFVFCAGIIRLYHGNPFYPGAPLPPVEELRRLFFAAAATGLLWFVILSARNQFPAHFFWGFWLLCFISLPFLIIFRTFMRIFMKRTDLGQIPVLLAGAGRGGKMLRNEFDRNAYLGFHTVGFLDDSSETEDRLGTLADAGKVADSLGVHTICTCIPPEVVQKYMREYIRHFKYILVMLADKTFPISWAYPANIHGFPGLEFQNQLLLPGPRFLKGILELFLASFAILTLWPVFFVLALLVKLSSPGPVFYSANRLGRGGKSIRVLKFRTMYDNADKALDDLLAANPALREEWLTDFKLENDPRITKIGRFLRKSSLDELPQLFNVLRGEMAMIGPRPIVSAEKSFYGDDYEVFSRVKPGISGLWQISGRNDVSYEQRISLDMYYILNWSVWLDLYILLMTFFEVLRRRGAR